VEKQATPGIGGTVLPAPLALMAQLMA